MAGWYALTIDNLMQQQLEADGESNQRNRNDNADAETAEPDTSARSQPNIPPATQPPSTSQSAKSSKIPRVHWDLRKTRVFLEALVTALDNGARYRTSNKPAARAELLECVLPRMKAAFPTTVWSITPLTSKFKSLEMEMKRALTLITRSGNHYDDETGMIETTDEQWEEFERKYGDKVKTIRIKGIPWVYSLMKQVWPDSRPTDEGVEGVEGARASKRRREEEVDEADTPDTAPSTPGARDATTPTDTRTQAHKFADLPKPKRRHRRLDQLLPQRSQPTFIDENSLRLFFVAQNTDSMRRAIEICVKDFGEELGAAGRQAVGRYFVEHPEFLAVFLAYANDDRRVFLVSKGLIEEADEDSGGDEENTVDIDGLVRTTCK
ncbi:hypothetical protein E4U57_004844 [Claviceps arundinis]|uniref:Myb/SANT-like domain-containing protein n=1 Tax=Claviceps arundinis TaxID=1623583 RepID=A0A9P7SQX2_9HYPO|nr:hypothetical protein E4U57_004844 [Claviceps arundinis]KAG5967873.1 hypothetical protein E4U56_000626 [Claviceps arundinis]